MNKKTILMAIMLTLNSSYLAGAIGCMDNSYHTKRKNDHKEYHYVQCNCPCHKYRSSFVRGKCPKCGHYHDPGEFEILTYAELKEKYNLDDENYEGEEAKK
ncbi:hypothetical protein ACFLYU_02695 [Candidatus Dependentiae bacterium]